MAQTSIIGAIEEADAEEATAMRAMTLADNAVDNYAQQLEDLGVDMAA